VPARAGSHRVGVITYKTNPNTSAVVRALAAAAAARPAPASAAAPHGGLRILLETDAPYMVPANIYADLDGGAPRGKLPLSHAAMIPWTAACVAEVAEESRKAGAAEALGAATEASATEGAATENASEPWSVERVLSVARENARAMYGI
jgi:TatD DNase family protein